MEKLKKEIFDKVKITRFKSADCTDVGEYAHLVKDNIWDNAINTALKEKKRVYIPNLGKEILINSSIVMDDDCVLIVDENQVIANTEKNGLCMVMNSRIKSGAYNAVDRSDCNKNIYVEGGIWSPNRHNDIKKFVNSDENPFMGVFTIMLFTNIENLTLRNCTFENSRSYATEISNIKGFLIENIRFLDYKKDGIHLNGPAEYGIIKNLEGENMLDDLVAFNAWDWDTSATTFGTIDHVFVENVKSNNNEFRLLPGRKTFSDGAFVECDIKNCIFKDITGVYTYKLYCQKNWKEAFDFSYSDHSETVGNLENIYFENIRFDKVRSDGFSEITVNGLFDCCADMKDIHFNNISVDMDKAEFDKTGLKMVSVGPISYTWKRHYPDEPEKWGELFSPDAVCKAENITFENITFGGVKMTEIDDIMSEVHLKINPDYPKTTPKGGTGYGTVLWDICSIE